MLKKIIFTALVILLVYLVVRWRQVKTQEIAANPAPSKPVNPSIYYLAGAVFTLMIVAFIFVFTQ